MPDIGYVCLCSFQWAAYAEQTGYWRLVTFRLQQLAAGNAITSALPACTGGNRLYRRMWRAVYGSVKQGKKIQVTLGRSNLLPKSVVQMISAGEESGKLGEVLEEISTYYNKLLRDAIKSMTSMIEPLMIVLMGSIVGFIAMAIILPIFKMSSLVSGG